MDDKIIFTPDTNILYSLIFHDIADSSIINMHNKCQTLTGLDKSEMEYRIENDLYNRPYYEMMRGLIRDGKVSMKISPIVYSEMMYGSTLDKYVDIAIDATVSSGDATLVSPDIIRQVFDYYIKAKYGSKKKFEKQNSIEYRTVLYNSVLADILTNSSSNKIIRECRTLLKTLVKRKLINKSLAKLGGDVSFLTLPTTDVGIESEIRSDIYELSENYRIYRGGKQEDQSVPAGEINDSLIMALASRCNIVVVTNDKQGLVGSSKHIASTNKKFHKATGRLTTGQPQTLSEFIDTFFPDYVVDFSKTYTPSPVLDHVDTHGFRQDSMRLGVEKATASIKKGQYQRMRESAKRKQMTSFRAEDVVDVSSADFFTPSASGDFQYESTEEAVSNARARQFVAFEKYCKDSVANLDERFMALHNMLFAVDTTRAKPKATRTVAKDSILQSFSQELYRDVVIFNNHIVKKLNSAYDLGELNAYATILSKVGISVDTSNTKSVSIDYKGMHFAEYQRSKKEPKPVDIRLDVELKDSTMLMCLLVPETKAILLGGKKSMVELKKTKYRQRYARMDSLLGSIDHKDYMISFNHIIDMPAPTNTAYVEAQDKVSKITGKISMMER